MSGIAEPSRNALGAKTFNVLAKPDLEWVWGQSELIDCAGSYGEEGTFYFGETPVIELFRDKVVAHLTQHALGRTAAVGCWQSGSQSVLLVNAMTSGKERLIPDRHYVAWFEEAGRPSGITEVGTNMLMGASSDGFWVLLDAAADMPYSPARDDRMGLALKLLPVLQREKVFSAGPSGAALGDWLLRQGAKEAPAAPAKPLVRL